MKVVDAPSAICTLASLVLLGTAACAHGSAGTDERTVATVNGVRLTGRNLRHWLERAQQAHTMGGVVDAPTEPGAAIEDRIAHLLLAQEAERLGIGQDAKTEARLALRAFDFEREAVIARRGEAALAELRAAAAVEVDEERLAALTPGDPPEPEAAVVTVDGVIFTAADVVAALRALLDRRAYFHLGSNLDKQKELRREVVDGLVERELVRAELALLPPEQWRADFDSKLALERERELVRQLRATTFASQVQLEEAELETFVSEHAEELRGPERWSVQIIQAKTEAAIMRAKAELDAGAAFGAVARAHSMDHRSRSQDGMVGWVPARDLVPDLREAMGAVAIGELVGPVAVGETWILAERLGSEEGKMPPRAMLLRTARHHLTRERLQAIEEKYVEALRAAAQIEVDPEALNALAALGAENGDSPR